MKSGSPLGGFAADAQAACAFRCSALKHSPFFPRAGRHDERSSRRGLLEGFRP